MRIGIYPQSSVYPVGKFPFPKRRRRILKGIMERSFTTWVACRPISILAGMTKNEQGSILLEYVWQDKLPGNPSEKANLLYGLLLFLEIE